jgi:membrane associated rhomboid family serine protease
MFIPIGDNIERRTFPVIPVVLILVNVIVFAIQFRTFNDAYRAASEAENAKERLPSSDPWEEFYEEQMRDIEAIHAAHEAEYAFMKTWGLVPADLSRGQVIGLLSHMFMHGDIFHILGNMLCLWAFACSLEVGFGRWTFLGFYVLFGLAGGLAHYATNISSEIPLVGASGAIAGLIGAYTVLYGPFSKIKMLIFFAYRAFTVEVPAAVFGFAWFMLQLMQASFDADGAGGVAWFAHIGGFIAGVAITLVCRNDTAADLTADDRGNLVFDEKRQPTRAAASPTIAAQPEPVVPTVCTYCRTDLSRGHALSPNLIRCGNPDCQRLVYLDTPNVPQPV